MAEGILYAILMCYFAIESQSFRYRGGMSDYGLTNQLLERRGRWEQRAQLGPLNLIPP